MKWHYSAALHYCTLSSFVFTISILYLVMTLLSYPSEWAFSVLHCFFFLCLFICLRVHYSSDVSSGVLKFFPLFLDMLIQSQDFRCHIEWPTPVSWTTAAYISRPVGFLASCSSQVPVKFNVSKPECIILSTNLNWLPYSYDAAVHSCTSLNLWIIIFTPSYS